MTLIVHQDLEQGSDEWLAARCGIITASVIGRLITPTLKVANNDTARATTLSLAAERITGHVEPVYVNADMQRGHDEEGPARYMYALGIDEPVTEVGFMTEDKWGFTIGYSPDALVGDDGLFETKSRRQKKQVSTIVSGRVPPENYMQLQCGLLVSGREWIDYGSYSNGMHFWTKRIHPDAAAFEAIIAAAERAELWIASAVEKYDDATRGLPMAERIDYDTEMVI